MQMLLQSNQHAQEEMSEMGPIIILILLLSFVVAVMIVASVIFLVLRRKRPQLTFLKSLAWCIAGGAVGVGIHTYAIIFNRISRDGEEVRYYSIFIFISLVLFSMILFGVIGSSRNRKNNSGASGC